MITSLCRSFSPRQVSERFSQYIDSTIQASGAASGSTETLQRLQQFLEPMLFLSGLELANTFEHFYRSERRCRPTDCGVWIPVIQQSLFCPTDSQRIFQN